MEEQQFPFFNDLVVVIVIYGMKIDESPAYLSLAAALQCTGQSATLFIYDNSSHPQQHKSTEDWQVIYKNDPTNPGVSFAYNQGFAWAKAHDKKWLLLVDQDTTFPSDAFDAYRRALKLNAQVIVPKLVDRSGVVSPLKFRWGGGQRLHHLQSGRQLELAKYYFHNSGLLVATHAFEKAGTYDENLPLDFSDFSFVRRLLKENQLFALADFECRHDLSATSDTLLSERLKRFKSYITACSYFKHNYANSDWLIMPRAFARAIKLTLLSGSLRFIHIALAS